MNGPDGNLSLLSEEQRRIVELGADARVLVTAGAGTGKTHCLVHRLAHLVDEEDVSPADTLALSFSRPAVREIRQRLASSGGLAAHTEVRTFDSYATSLLSEVSPEGPWTKDSYDDRIGSATHLVQERSERVVDLVRGLAHLAVDEVQDLVGVRAEFVKALLGLIDGGFTLLGDPAQGIYGFQLTERAERIRGAAELYEWVRHQFGGALIEEELTGNHRALDTGAKAALPKGAALAQVDADFRAVHRELRTFLLSADCHLGGLEEALPVLAGFTDTPTAVLCRTNGQALQLSTWLHERGVTHRLQRPGLDQVVPAWVSGLFHAFDTSRPSKDDVLSYLGGLAATAEQHPSDVWRLLKRMDSNRTTRGTLDLSSVARQLRRRQLPDELVHRPTQGLVLSTIHRAKGLEFDNVVIVDQGDVGDDPVEQAEEARLLYVAMTRPRELLLRLQMPRALTTGIVKNLELDRWVKHHPTNQQRFRGRRYGMEMRDDDVHAEDPGGTIGFAASPHTVQKYLATALSAGSPVSLSMTDQEDECGRPRYVVEHSGTAIGVTSDTFASALHREIGHGRRRPSCIKDVHVDCVETVTGSEAVSHNHNLGPFGIWLRPRIVGMGRFVWTPREGRE